MAVKTIQVQGELDSSMKIAVNCGNHQLIMDQPKGAGGQDSGPTPLEAMLATIAGCFGTVGRIIAHQQKLPLSGMQFSIEADYDPAVLLGKPSEARAGFSEVRVKVDIQGDMDDSTKQSLLEQIEQRCPIADNLLRGTRLVSSLG